ncbi:RND family transporter [Balneola sp. MJW-20]|uniref:efflux RND transporter permease subunit n=1 Tax=Gracilimonas aurantiaca TaxID=3234185 RepID=UPI0034663DC4
MHKFAEFLIKHPRLFIGLFIVLVAASLYPASQIRTDFNLENFYPKDDQTVQYYRLLEEDFGRDDNIMMVGFRSDSLFSRDVLLDLKAITDSVAVIPNITDVRSLWSAEEIRNINNTLQFNRYLDEDSLASQNRSVGIKIAQDPILSGLMINDSLNTTAIYLSIDEGNNSYSTRSQITEDLNRVLADYPSIDFKISGIPYFRNQYVSILNQEVIFYIAFSSALIIAFLWYLYRSKWGILLPMIIVWLTVLFTIATITLTGGYLEIMSSTIAPILLCVGVADSIHMISKFDDAIQNGMKRKKAIIEMMLTLGSATFLTSITTAIGFGTLLTSNVIPMRRFGIYTAVGVLIAYVVTITLLPAILKFSGSRKVFQDNGGKLYPFMGKWLLRLSYFNQRNYKKIVVVSGLIILLTGFGMSQLRVNGRVFDDVSRDSELIKDSQFFSDNLAPIFPLEVIIDTDNPEGIYDPGLLQKISRLEDHLLSYPEIRRTNSLVTLLSQIHKTMAPEDHSINPIPQDPALIAQYILLLEINGVEALSNLTDFDYSKVRLTAQTIDAGSQRINEIRASVRDYLSEQPGDEEIIITGSTVLSADLVGKMVWSLASSIGLAFICISIVMALLFKDLKMVLISLIPNILPLVMIAGIMGYFGIDIKPSTAVIFTIAFGIAVDDTIHYLARFRVELKRGATLQEALTLTTQKTGRAMIITSLILLAGFGSLITSQFTSTTLMGILVGSTIFIALFADLILLPALFNWIKPDLKGTIVAEEPSGVPGSEFLEPAEVH